MPERIHTLSRDDPDFGITGHVGAGLGMAFCVLVIALTPLVLQVSLLATLLTAIAVGAGVRLRKGLNNTLLAGGLALVVVFFEPMALWGGPIFFASLVLFPLGVMLIGLASGGRLRWVLERAAGVEL